MEFEQRRHVPVKYNRELVSNTLKVMKRVAQIKERRNADLWKARMAASDRQEAKDAVKALHHHADWIEDVDAKQTALEDLNRVKEVVAESKARKREREKQRRRAERQKAAVAKQAEAVSV